MARRWRPEMGGKQSELDGQQAAGIGMCMRAGGQTCLNAVALAVREDPPSPAVRPGPIHGMGRAVRYRAHALTGLASAKRNAEDERHPSFARSLIPRPAQGAKVYSAHDSDHEDMRKLRWHARVDKRAHLSALPESFERRTASCVQQRTRRGQQRLGQGKLRSHLSKDCLRPAGFVRWRPSARSPPCTPRSALLVTQLRLECGILCRS